MIIYIVRLSLCNIDSLIKVKDTPREVHLIKHHSDAQRRGKMMNRNKQIRSWIQINLRSLEVGFSF